MKKSTTLILSVFLALAIQSKAQVIAIPNGSFENWTSMGSYEVPGNWGTLNPSTASTGVFTAVKATPGSPGNYYIKLTTKNAGGILKPGVIVSGELDPVTMKAVSGFPCNQRVQSLTGNYQYMGYGTDGATFNGWLTRWDNVLMARDTIATLHYVNTGMLHVWTPFSIKFDYINGEMPDTAIIRISSSGDNPVLSSFIWLDNLGFEGTVTSTRSKIINSAVNIYPCPAVDFMTVDFNSKTSYPSLLTLIDAHGKVIIKLPVNIAAGFNNLKIGLEDHKIPSGLYFMEMQTPEGTLSGKVMISH